MNLAQKLLREILRQRQQTEAGFSQAALAREIGVSPPFLSQVINGLRRPGPTVLGYLGLEAHESYRRADDRKEAPGSVA